MSTQSIFRKHNEKLLNNILNEISNPSIEEVSNESIKNEESFDCSVLENH